MNQRIIHPTDDGIMILVPADCGLSISEIARKDVPAGVPYIIVDVSDIPEDRTYRNAWECDFSNPDGYGIGADAWRAEKELENLDVNN